MVYRMALVSVLFLSQVAMAFSKDANSQPVIAPLPDHVVIQHWKDRVANTKTFYAEFSVTVRDRVFKTIKCGKGKVFLKGGKECRYEIIPISKQAIQEVQIKQKEKCYSLPHSILLWKEDGTLTGIDPVDKTYWRSRSRRPYIVPDFIPSCFSRYQLLSLHAREIHLPKISVESTKEYYFITLHPTGSAKAWSEMKIALNIKTGKLLGIHKTVSSGCLETTWLFSKIEFNQHIQNNKGLLDVSYKGYRDLLESTKTRQNHVKTGWQKTTPKPTAKEIEEAKRSSEKRRRYFNVLWRIWQLT